MSLSKLSPLSSLFKLPNEVLSCVLNNPAIPLVRRLRLRLLSNRCCDIIEDGLKKTSSLVIQEEEDDDDINIRKPDVLIIKQGGLTNALIRILARLFPEPHELTLVLGFWENPSVSWNTVPALLAHLGSTNLATIKLYGYTKKGSNFKRIADALLALSALTSLTLVGDSYDRHPLCDRLLPHLGAVLSRLETFICPDYLDDSTVSLISSSLSSRCTHLMLRQAVFHSLPRPFLAQLSASVTHLDLFGFGSGIHIWPSQSPMHTLRLSLSSLAVTLEQFDLDSSVFSNLAPFTRLTNLKLYTLNYSAPLALPSKKEMPLPAVKRLTLGLIVNSGASFDGQLFLQNINVWFPSLTHFTLIGGDRISAMRANLGKLPFQVEFLYSQ